MRKLLILTVLLVTSFLVACTNQWQQEKQWQMNQWEQSQINQWQQENQWQMNQWQQWQTQKLTEEQQQARQKIMQAIQSNDPSICDDLKNQEYKDACKQNVIISQAEKKADSSVCDQLEDETMKANCIDVAIMSEAMQKQDSSICEQLESSGQATKEQKVNACKQRINLQWQNQTGWQKQNSQWE